MITQAPSHDVEILSRLFDVAPEELTREFAHFLLGVQFGGEDKDRMHELSQKVRDGDLTEAEQAEINSYERVGHVLGILQAKARIRLKSETISD
jgi:hypothetical protein